jgi:hypothetical protein
VEAAHAESLESALTEARRKIYRRKGNIETVLRNCRLVAEANKKLDSATPQMNRS